MSYSIGIATEFVCGSSEDKLVPPFPRGFQSCDHSLQINIIAYGASRSSLFFFPRVRGDIQEI